MQCYKPLFLQGFFYFQKSAKAVFTYIVRNGINTFTFTESYDFVNAPEKQKDRVT